MGGHSFFGGGGGGGGGGGHRIHYSNSAPVVVAPVPVIVVSSGATYYPPRTYVNKDAQPSTNGEDSCATGSKCISITFQVLLVACMIVYAVVMGLKLPRDETFEVDLGLSETRIFDISSVWYSRFQTGWVNFSDDPQITDDDRSSNVTLLVFDSAPPLTKTDEWAYVSSVNVSEYSFTYLSWFFYPGSSLAAAWNSSSDEEFQVVVIQGVHGYNLWESGNEDYYDYIVDIYIEVNGSNHFFNTTFMFEDFYFVIWAAGNVSVETPIQYDIIATLLDTSNSTSNCTLPCEVSVGYKSSQVYVFQTPLVSEYANFGSPNTVFTMYPTKYSRKWVIALCFSLPLGFMVLLFLTLMNWSCEKRLKYEKITQTPPAIN
eukprot:Phypoly_transcript_07044.p1 GENE.Phypoly_transcript_07044~~Phypoly_transcript_07044.p1  ORF type:complete len:373 (+),score=45.66 Phypoly_transcript_07044:520-1638(+)